MSLHRSISVFVPALNEEENLRDAVTSIREILRVHFEDWEILICNDGSTDRTGAIAEELSREDGRIHVFHHGRPRNIGASYMEAARAATKQYFVMFPGDNENDAGDMSEIFDLAGTADLIIPFTVNPEVRPWHRRALSCAFIALLNLLSGRRLRYYNGTVLHRTDLLRTCQVGSRGFGYQAELIVELLKRNCSYRELPVRIVAHKGRTSRAFSMSNLKDVGALFVRLALKGRSNVDGFASLRSQ